jgi:hypothetical protein
MATDAKQQPMQPIPKTVVFERFKLAPYRLSLFKLRLLGYQPDQNEIQQG